MIALSVVLSYYYYHYYYYYFYHYYNCYSIQSDSFLVLAAYVQVRASLEVPNGRTTSAQRFLYLEQGDSMESMIGCARVPFDSPG